MVKTKYELTPFEYRILDRILQGHQLVDPHEMCKPGFVFLRSNENDSIRCWELVPRATLDRLVKCGLIVAQLPEWHYHLQADITSYIYGEA